MPERDDETVKYLTEANLRLRTELDAMTEKRNKARENSNRHLSAMAYWRKRAGEVDKTEQLLEAANRVNAAMTKQVDDLTSQLENAREYSREASKANERLEERVREQAHELAQLRVELTVLRNKYNVTDADRENYQDEIKRLKQRVNGLLRSRKIQRRMAA